MAITESDLLHLLKIFTWQRDYYTGIPKEIIETIGVVLHEDDLSYHVATVKSGVPKVDSMDKEVVLIMKENVLKVIDYLNK